MTYDLTFYQRAGKSIFQRGDPPLTKEDVLRWGRSQAQITPGLTAQAAGEGLEINYHNPDTGVDFQMSFTPTRTGGRSDAESGVPREFRASGLQFILNYSRPSFYALEAMPIVANMARSLSLLVRNPQDSEAATIPQPCDEARLIATWSQANAQSFKIMRQLTQPFARMAPATSLAWWQYMYQKRRLAAQFGDSIFVPQLFVLIPREGVANEQTLSTSLVWTSGDPIVLPTTEYISTTTAMGYVAAGPVLQALAPYLEPLANPLGADIKVLRPGHEREVKPLYESLIVDKPLTAFSMTRDVDIIFDDTGAD